MCLWKYKRIRYKGIVCDVVGWKYRKKVRSRACRHINLVVPIAHIWYFRSLPNKIGYLLGLPSKKLDMIIYTNAISLFSQGIAKSLSGRPIGENGTIDRGGISRYHGNSTSGKPNTWRIPIPTSLSPRWGLRQLYDLLQ